MHMRGEKREDSVRVGVLCVCVCVQAGDSPSMEPLWGKMCLCRAAQPPSSLPSPSAIRRERILYPDTQSF